MNNKTKDLFVHDSNLQTKIKNNYNHKKRELSVFYQNEYLPVHNLLEKLCKNPTSNFDDITKCINDYLAKLSTFSSVNAITSQSKFRSTFLEEISAYLFVNVKEIKSGLYGIFNKKIYAGMKIEPNGDVSVLTKDVDFCIGKKINIKIDNQRPFEIIIPIVAVEVKTYLDATMFGEVQFSAKAIKNATPNARTYVLMETNQVGKEKILAARHDNTINELFVLKKDDNSVIDSAVLEDFYNEIIDAINDINQNQNIVVPGRLLNLK